MYELLAAVTAIAVSLVELLASRTGQVRRHAVPWIAVRMLVDGAVAVVAFPLVETALPDNRGTAMASVIAGLSGAAALRASISIERGPGRKLQLGPEQVYGRLSERINAKLDVLGASAYSNWVMHELLPVLEGMSFDHFALRTTIYIQSRELLSDEDRNAQLTAIGLVDAQRIPEDEKRRRLLDQLLGNGDHDFLRSLVTSR